MAGGLKQYYPQLADDCACSRIIADDHTPGRADVLRFTLLDGSAGCGPQIRPRVLAPRECRRSKAEILSPIRRPATERGGSPWRWSFATNGNGTIPQEGR